MEDIRFTEVDGEYLFLETSAGEKYRLLVDDHVRNALKRENRSKLDQVSLSPRDIQDAVRDGESLSSIAERSGASFDFVEKIAAPVLAELAHIVDTALSVRLGLSADRESGSLEFGELMTARLHEAGATAIGWSAKRSDLGIWHIHANFAIGEASEQAHWSFDPRKLTLSPENGRAIALANNAAPRAFTATSNGQVAASTPAAFAAPALKSVPDKQMPPTPPAEAAREVVAVVTPPAVPDPAPLSATADLLQALKRKRVDLEVDADLDTTAVLPVVSPIEDSETAPAAPSVAKKGRASMPSWDEIVFGTKTED